MIVEIIGVVIAAGIGWALNHLYHRRANRRADGQHQDTQNRIIAEFKRIPASAQPPSDDGKRAHEFRQEMRANVIDFFFGVVLRRHPETWARALEATEDMLEGARRENDHPERIRVLESVVIFLRSPPA